MNWKTLNADGCEWEVRAVASGTEAQEPGDSAREILEFRTVDVTRPPRRVEVDAGALSRMTDQELRAAYRMSRPIGGDYYGRPGKQMPDAKE
ncbi:MAG: hypothetical protein ACRELX_05535 [Longimicrobiales bacterium]